LTRLPAPMTLRHAPLLKDPGSRGRAHQWMVARFTTKSRAFPPARACSLRRRTIGEDSFRFAAGQPHEAADAVRGRRLTLRRPTLGSRCSPTAQGETSHLNGVSRRAKEGYPRVHTCLQFRASSRLPGSARLYRPSSFGGDTVSRVAPRLAARSGRNLRSAPVALPWERSTPRRPVSNRLALLHGFCAGRLTVTTPRALRISMAAISSKGRSRRRPRSTRIHYQANLLRGRGSCAGATCGVADNLSRLVVLLPEPWVSSAPSRRVSQRDSRSHQGG
jgi:hypothetical protein